MARKDQRAAEKLIEAPYHISIKIESDRLGRAPGAIRLAANGDPRAIRLTAYRSSAPIDDGRVARARAHKTTNHNII